MQRNRYAGICVTCNKRCAPGDGIPMKSEGARWRVQHVKCSGLQDGEGAKVATQLAPTKYDFTKRGRRSFVGLDPW